MRCSSLLASMCVLLAAVCVGRAESVPPAQKPIRVLLTLGGHGFDRKPFFALWDSLPGIQYTTCQLPVEADLLKPGLESKYDVVVMYDMSKGFTAAQERNFKDLLKTGIGVVSLHHNLCSHADWEEFGKIIGGRYFQKPETIDGKEYPGSHYLHGQHFEVKLADREHPITKGLSNFELDDEAYSGFWVAPDSHVLLTVDHPKCDHNVAWTTHSGKSRVFYLMFGHGPSAWQNPVYPQLLARGIRWAAEGKADVAGPAK
ncbi:MAG TPA: ThuA domain-containing protein [Tepidisphaeraceae bacterium]|nr:ThuA domain-containing protein [Tepidisphaeraceae bacterium]